MTKEALERYISIAQTNYRYSSVSVYSVYWVEGDGKKGPVVREKERVIVLCKIPPEKN